MCCTLTAGFYFERNANRIVVIIGALAFPLLDAGFALVKEDAIGGGPVVLS